MKLDQDEVQKIPKESRYSVTWDQNPVGKISDNFDIDTYLHNQLQLRNNHRISFDFSETNDVTIDRMTGGAQYDERVHRLPIGPLIIYGHKYKWTIFKSGLKSLSPLTFTVYYNQQPWKKEPIEYETQEGS